MQIVAKNLKKIFTVPVKEKELSLLKKFQRLFYQPKQEFIALDNVSFSIKKGEFVGYIGPNGAGKSTTIKMLTGIITPTVGSIEILGLHPHKQRYEYSKHIGVVFGQRRLLQYDVSVMDSLLLYKEIYELSMREFEQRIELFSKILRLDKYLHIPVRKLSLGERMRCEIAASLLHKPKIVFLDEPTIGLDQIAKEEIRDFLKYINKEWNTTILLTTHDMDDIEELCKRIILIDSGCVLHDGSLQSLKQKVMATKDVTIHFTKITNKEKLNNLLKHSAIEVLSRTKSTLACRLHIKKITVPDFIKDVFSSLDISDLNIQEPRLEQIIKEIYKNGMQRK